MGPDTFVPVAPLILRSMARKPDDPADLRNRELRARENRGMSLSCSSFRIQIIDAQSNSCAVASVTICPYETTVHV